MTKRIFSDAFSRNKKNSDIVGDYYDLRAAGYTKELAIKSLIKFYEKKYSRKIAEDILREEAYVNEPIIEKAGL